MTAPVIVGISVAVAIFVSLLAVAVSAAALLMTAAGAWVWSRAISAAHQATSHSLSVKQQSEIDDQAWAAIQEAERRKATAAAERQRFERMPTDDEIMEGVRAEREDRPPRNTMDSNEGIDEAAMIEPDRMYNAEEDRFASV